MKKEVAKYIIVMVFMAMMLIGCGEGIEKEKDKTVKEEQELRKRQKEMEQYLEQKYGKISYEVTGVVWKFWNQPYDQMNFCVEREGRKEACWVRRYEKEEKPYFMDSYFGLCIREEYEQKMEEKAIRFFQKAKVFSFTQETGFSEAIDKEDGLEEAREKGENLRVISWMFVTGIKEEELERLTSQFCRSWETEEMESLVSVFLVGKEMFDELSRESAENIIQNGQYQIQSVCYTKGSPA